MLDFAFSIYRIFVKISRLLKRRLFPCKGKAHDPKIAYAKRDCGLNESVAMRGRKEQTLFQVTESFLSHFSTLVEIFENIFEIAIDNLL